ncbi:glycosyl transferase [Bacteroidia bacterium]|nr:glycosyl transferase [Bacteroidia bacterium]
MRKNNARIIAFYLPQFHPIPENDEWWGKGFTEWTNVGKAKPLFRGHDQPKVPADLGYYDLRVPEIRDEQAQMAKEAGIEGFCYWHYWFGNGKKLLERPFNEVLTSGKPDFPFCLAWANHSWKGIYCGVKSKESLINQTYNGIEDYKQYFYDVLPAFRDKRYIRVDDKPFFLVFSPFEIPDSSELIDCWQQLAIDNGLKGVHFVAHSYLPTDIDTLISLGYDAVNIVRLFEYQRKGISIFTKVRNKINRKIFDHGFWCQYKDAMKYFFGTEDKYEYVYPTLVPNWDHSPRTGKYGTILKGSTPELFYQHAKKTIESVRNKNEDHQVIILKSWNEWAEGNYMEPDLKHGKGYLNVLKKAIENV